MDLSGLGAGIFPGYIQGQEKLAQAALLQQAEQDQKAQLAGRAAAARWAAAQGQQGQQGGLGGLAQPGGLGGLSTAPPPPPQGPGQPSVPMQQPGTAPPQGAPPLGGMPPGANPPPPQGAPPGPPPGAAARPAPPPGPPAGGQQAGPATSGGVQQQVPPSPMVQQAQSQISQLAQQIMKANPNLDTKSTDGALALFSAIQQSQVLQDPMAKEYVAAMKQTLAERSADQKYETAIQKINQDAANKLMEAQTHTQIAEISAAAAIARAQAAIDARSQEGDKNRGSREKIAGQRTDAQLGQLAAKNGVAVPYRTPPEEAQKLIAEAIAKKMDQGVISDDAAQFVADAMKTDPSVISHVASGPKSNESKKKVWEIVSKPGFMQPEDLAKAKVALAGSTSEERTIGRQAGNVALGTAELDQFAPLVIDAAKKVPRSQYPTLNSITQAAARGTGDPNVVALANNIQALKSAYTQILVRGGQSGVDARKRTDEVISPNMSPAQLEAAIKTMYQESKGASAAAKKASSSATGSVGEKPSTADDGVIKYDAQGNRVP